MLGSCARHRRVRALSLSLSLSYSLERTCHPTLVRLSARNKQNIGRANSF